MQKPRPKSKPVEPQITDADILLNWRSLNANVAKLDEKTAERLLTNEIKHRRRKQFILRLIGRWQMMRDRREREEIMQEVLNGAGA